MKNNKTEKKTSDPSDLIRSDLTENILRIESIFSETPDMVIRKLTIKHTSESAALIYLNGLTDRPALNNDVLRPLQLESNDGKPGDEPILAVGHMEKESEFTSIELSILLGSSVLFIEGREYAYILGTSGWPQRAIEDPQLETSLKGAHQGFVETSGVNIALVRRYIPSHQLKMRRLVIGERGQTSLTIMYLADVMNPQLNRRA